MLKKLLRFIALVLALVMTAGGVFVWLQVSTFDKSMAKAYAIEVPAVTASSDPAVLARGKHLAESIGGCASADCHGADLGGGRPQQMGPVGTFTGPNITPGALLDGYTDGELARLVQHGLKKDGRSLTFMPAQDFAWWPQDDVVALVSYLRTVPVRTRANGPVEVGMLGKVLDRTDVFIADVARRISHESRLIVPAPAPTAAYGAYLAKMCEGCHGTKLSGGKVLGMPAVPSNLTPHETGLAKYDFAAFDLLLTTGKKRDGSQLNPVMPYQAFGAMNETEKKALFAYLQSLPPTPFGGR